MIHIEGLNKRYGERILFEDVSWHVKKRDRIGLSGPNGSGKTTLFNLIAGALRPDRGRIRLQGRDVAGLPPHRLCARGVARTFQLVRPFAGLSALDNVRVGCLYGRTRGEIPGGGDAHDARAEDQDAHQAAAGSAASPA